MSHRLENKVAIVTGGAGGLGIGIATCFLREGAKVVLTDLKESTPEKELVASHSSASFRSHNVTNENEWMTIVNDTVSKYGHLDVLVNNAGIAPALVPVDQETLDDWKHVIDVDLTSNFLGIKHAMLAMKGRGGSIINISSIEGLVGNPYTAAYNAAKGGTRLLTKSAALDATTGGYNVRVNSVHPGVIKTPLVPEDQGEQLAKSMIPMKHLGSPKDIGEICTYLASDESSYATGAEFTVDGGYTAQ